MDKITNPKWIQLKIIIAFIIISFILFILLFSLTEYYYGNYGIIDIFMFAIMLISIPLLGFTSAQIPKYVLISKKKIVIVSQMGNRIFLKDEMSHYDTFKFGTRRIVINQNGVKKLIILDGFKKNDQIKIIENFNLDPKPFEFIAYWGFLDWNR